MLNPAMDRSYSWMRISDTAEWHHVPEQKMREKEEKPSPEVRRRSNARPLIGIRLTIKYLPMSQSQGGIFYFFAAFRSNSGSVWFTTLSSVMVHFTTSFMPGISYMTFCMIFSMIARRPRAPVLRSIAWRAIA